MSALDGFKPRVAVVLGSGLGGFVEHVTVVETIPYGDLPDFPAPGVGSHAGRLVLGHVGPTPVAVMQGRAHYYERGRADEMKGAIRALVAAGCETLLLTNAAGSLRPDMPPGSLMVVSDHINFAGANPLLGETGDSRFVDMLDAYDPDLRVQLIAAGERVGLSVFDGVYIWFSGPSFETPAEIRAARVLGADAVGMSTVPETILARHAGLKVAALSLVTNHAAGLGGEKLSHEQTLAVATRSAADVGRLLRTFLERYR